MLQISTRLSAPAQTPAEAAHATDSVTLDYDSRQKARIKTVTDAGLPAGIFLERGKPLQIGEVLQSDCGRLIVVKGALEAVVTAQCDDWLTFAKACYHLGNRHTRLQVGERWLRFKPDHVLEQLMCQSGLSVSHSPAIFAPEDGAYKGLSGHSHGHAHPADDEADGHSHSHSHSHTHVHQHDHVHGIGQRSYGVLQPALATLDLSAGRWRGIAR